MRMKNQIQYIILDTLGGIFTSDPPASRGLFRQIVRQSPTGKELCLYCGSQEIDGNSRETYGAHMALMDYGSLMPRPEEFALKDHQGAISKASAEWVRAERARQNAQDTSSIDEAMARRFACAMLCSGCQAVADRAATAQASGTPGSANRTARASGTHGSARQTTRATRGQSSASQTAQAA